MIEVRVLGIMDLRKEYRIEVLIEAVELIRSPSSCKYAMTKEKNKNLVMGGARKENKVVRESRKMVGESSTLLAPESTLGRYQVSDWYILSSKAFLVI